MKTGEDKIIDSEFKNTQEKLKNCGLKSKKEKHSFYDSNNSGYAKKSKSSKKINSDYIKSLFGEKRYNSFSHEMKKTFSDKIIKLSLDGGFTCPTRDGSKGKRGCIFCSERGSGEFTFSLDDIGIQIKKQREVLKNKWPEAKYIAYFQNFTNTYEKKDRLFKIYQRALEEDNVVGLAIATRADCLGDDVLEVLDYFNKKTFLFVEIGLQSIHEKTEKFIRRGYGLDVFEKSMKNLDSLGIKTVVHTILNIPTEDKKMMMQTYQYLNSMPLWGIKIQQLNILKNTDLEKYYEKNPFTLMEADEYIEFVADIIENLRKDITIHRLTGDGAKEDLIAPRWILNKRYILNGIDMCLKRRNSYQGINYRG